MRERYCEADFLAIAARFFLLDMELAGVVRRISRVVTTRYASSHPLTHEVRKRTPKSQLSESESRRVCLSIRPKPDWIAHLNTPSPTTNSLTKLTRCNLLTRRPLGSWSCTESSNPSLSATQSAVQRISSPLAPNFPNNARISQKIPAKADWREWTAE